MGLSKDQEYFYLYMSDLVRLRVINDLLRQLNAGIHDAIDKSEHSDVVEKVFQWSTEMNRRIDEVTGNE